MMVSINYTDKMREAWNAAITAHVFWQHLNGPKPDFDAWLAERNKKHIPTVRG